MLDRQITANFITNIIDNDLKNKLHDNVYTRFPPEPNGYLHIGHVKSICLNFGLANDYSGKCNLRFDDTNPMKEDAKYITAIKEDINWLGFKWHKITYSSDYFIDFYNYAKELINKKLAYVCFLTKDEIRQYRGTLTIKGKNSPYRNTTVSENLINFDKMKAGKFSAGKCVLRLKANMGSPFMCMRDPTIYRISFFSHHRTHDKWCIYPMYDFAHPIADAIENITHSLCTLEFQDNRRLYDFILDNLDDFTKSNRPRQYEFSRLNLAYTIMSKRKINNLINNNILNDWDDPRLPTIKGLRRRGYNAASLKDFIAKIGISKIDTIFDIKILEDSLRDNLNNTAKRTMAVISPVEVEIENYSANIETIYAPLHPQNPAMGTREIFFSKNIYIDKADFCAVAPNNKYKRLAIGKEVRLRNSYIVKAHSFDSDSNGNIIKILCQL